jgi:hydrogenase maturation factor
MMIMEIARVAELNLALRQSAFKPGKAAVTEQLLRIVRQGQGESDDPLLLPCISSLGCLSRTFAASQISRVVGLLVELLDNREPSVTREAMLALTKLVCPGNHLHVNHSKAIVDAGGAQRLVLLVYLGDKQLQIQALILLCGVALNVPENEELAQAGILDVLLWASKQVHLVQDVRVEALRTNAVGTLLD